MNIDSQKICVLILDDNPSDIEVITRLLSDVSDIEHELCTFTNFEKSIDYLEKNHEKVDVCLVDYLLPLHTAFDFINEIKQKDIELKPVVVMTSHPDYKVDMQLMEVGVHDYWDKASLNGDSLSRCLRYAIHQHSQMLNDREELANKSNQMAYLNHEIKNPLNAILGCTKMLEKIAQEFEGYYGKQRVKDCFEIIYRSYNGLDKLIHEFLDLSKLSKIDDDFDRQAIMLDAMVTDIVSQYKVQAEESDLQLTVSGSEKDVKVWADKEKIRIVLSNLISNAIKYTEAGGVSIDVAFRERIQHRWGVVAIKDTGIGVAEEDIPKLFMEFSKVHKNLKKKVDSTGLGLAITKRLVELHGGFLEVDSELGKGSEFRVYLPVRDP